MSRDDLRTLLYCSLRYALTRRSYMQKRVQGIVLAHADALMVRDCIQLADEVREALPHADPAGEWERFSERLRAAGVRG